MTLRYLLFNKPGNVNEVTDLLKSRSATSVKMELGEGCVDYETQTEVPICNYTIQTLGRELKIQHIFVAKNNLLRWAAGMMDASLLNYEDRQTALKKLQKQERELKQSGMETLLIMV